MTIVDEVAALLHQARKAKSEKELRELVEKLEAQVDRLRAELAQFEPRGERCPSCGLLTWFVTSSIRDKTFGALGGMKRTYTCKSCGFKEDKIVT